MPYNPEIHHRRSIRLKGYDYSQAGLHNMLTEPQIENVGENAFVASLKKIVAEARTRAYSAVNFAQVETNWLIGRKIVEQVLFNNEELRTEINRRKELLAIQFSQTEEGETV